MSFQYWYKVFVKKKKPSLYKLLFKEISKYQDFDVTCRDTAQKYRDIISKLYRPKTNVLQSSKGQKSGFNSLIVSIKTTLLLKLFCKWQVLLDFGPFLTFSLSSRNLPVMKLLYIRLITDVWLNLNRLRVLCCNIMQLVLYCVRCSCGLSWIADTVKISLLDSWQ